MISDFLVATQVALALVLSRSGGAIASAPSTSTAFVSPTTTSSRSTATAAHALSSTSTSSVRRGWFDPTTAMPPHTWRPFPQTEVRMRPDVSAKGFSAVNAFFFAGLSKIAYVTEDEARGLLVGNSTTNGLGFDRFHWFEGGEEARKKPFSNVQDTDAYVAASDDIIAVVFRGTKGIYDWYTNSMLKPKKCPMEWGVPSPGGTVHTGFDKGVDTVWNSRGSMRQVIKDLYNEKGKNRKLYLAGHSLGGALATNAAARLAFVDDMAIAGVYTMGSPRLFNRVAAKHFDCWPNHGELMKHKCFRCRNNKDPVTSVPGIPYVHAGTEIYIDQFGTISMNDMAGRILDQLLWCLRFEYISGIDDHATSEYIRLFKQIVLNSRVPLAEKAASVVMDSLNKAIFQRVAPDEMRRIRKMIVDMFQDMVKNKMMDDMFEGVEQREGLVQDTKGRARRASQDY